MKLPVALVLAAGLCAIAPAWAQPRVSHNDDLPVRAITLYRSGVASIERRHDPG